MMSPQRSRVTWTATLCLSAVLAPVLIWAGCAGSMTGKKAATSATASRPETIESDGSDDLAAAAPAAEGPVIYRPEKPTDVFPPAPPEGLIGIAVPVIVNEPVAVYKSDPEALAFAESLVMTLVPEPKRRSGPPRGEAPDPEVGVEGASLFDAGESRVSDTSSIQAPPPPSPSAAATRTDFDSLDFDDNAANTGGGLFIPPDPSGAAGPDHVMNVTNVGVQIHTKAGTELLDSTPGAPITGISLASFFSSLSPVNDLFDPKVIYDQHAERFVVVALEKQDDCFGDPTDSSRILVAVSDDDDPTISGGIWYFTAIPSLLTISSALCPTPVSTWADYPGFAVDEEAVYITMNQFTFGGGPLCASAFCDDRLWVIDKFTGAGGGFYGGGTATVSLFDPSPPSSGIFEFTPQPAHVFGTAPTSPNVGTWLTVFNGLTGGGAEFAQVVRFDDPIGPGTPTFVGPSFVSLGNIDDLPGALPDAPQLGSATAIETNDRRALHAVWRDNHRLYTTFSIEPEAADPNAGETTAHWVVMDTATLAGSPPTVPLVDQGDIGGEDIAADTHTFFPSIAVNSLDEVAIGFSASGPSIYAGSYYTTRKGTDPVTTTSGSETLRAGLDDYVRTFGGPSNRWGDYSGIAVDPYDQCFWVYNEHAIANGTTTMPPTEDGRWGTAWGYFCESCATQPAMLTITPGTMVSATDTKEAFDEVTASTLTVESTGDLTIRTDKAVFENGLEVETGGTLTVESCS